ncbi:MAG: arginyltransferase [Desulfobulbaceae bacterium]|nr:arginyltransferase [Desulfobulbaceae bacterium]
MNQDLSENERQFLNNLDHHLQNIPAECPYGLPHQAIYRMARFTVIPEEIMGILLAAGYRRYGNTVYTMGCENCRSCIPIKLDPFEFVPNRNQKRSSKRNLDLTIARNPLTPDKEAIALLQTFFDHRYPGKNNSAEDYYAGFFLNSSEFSAEIRYCSEGKLLGVSIIDVGRTWLNAVYFFFEPQSSKRSLGTFNIINLIDLCKEQNIHNLYLGYWIKESSAMNYKAAFQPHYVFVDEYWHKAS